MTVYDLVIGEASALVESAITERSAQVLGELDAVRHAVDATARILEAALANMAAAAQLVEHEGPQVAERLVAAATRSAETQAQAASAQAKTEAAVVIDALRRELQQAVDETRQLTAAFAHEKQALAASFSEEQRTLAASLAEVTATADALRRERDANQTRLEAVCTELEHRTTQLAKQTNEREKLESELARVTTQLAATTAQQAKAEADLAGVCGQLDAMAAGQATHDTESIHLAAQIEALTADRTKLLTALQFAQHQIEAGEAQRHALTRELEARAPQTAEPAHAATPLESLLAVFQQLASTRTIGEALTCIADGLVGEWSRVALFDVQDNRLKGQHQVGFESPSDISNIVVPLTMPSVFTDPVASNRVQLVTPQDRTDGTRAPLGGEPTWMLVLPLRVNGRMLAVIYADDVGESPASH
jgi:chromosome segregation ATPase